MDILYVVGNHSRHDFLELRLSLRSIEKYGRNVGRVVMAGFVPDFISDRVVKCPVEDKYRTKHSNILNCIETAVDRGLLDGEFLYSSDDHFYVKPTDFDNYPYFYKADYLPDYVNTADVVHRRYHWSLVYTKRVLEMAKLQYRNYAFHCNTHMSAETVRAARDLIRYSYWTPFGVEPTCLLMNMRMSLHPETPIVHRRDTKLEWADNRQQILDCIGDLECVSMADSAFECPEIMGFFREEFGRVSAYEIPQGNT